MRSGWFIVRWLVYDPCYRSPIHEFGTRQSVRQETAPSSACVAPRWLRWPGFHVMEVTQVVSILLISILRLFCLLQCHYILIFGVNILRNCLGFPRLAKLGFLIRRLTFSAVTGVAAEWSCSRRECEQASKVPHIYRLLSQLYWLSRIAAAIT